jgi:hypothetical protein
MQPPWFLGVSFPDPPPLRRDHMAIDQMKGSFRLVRLWIMNLVHSSMLHYRYSVLVDSSMLHYRYSVLVGANEHSILRITNGASILIREGN